MFTMTTTSELKEMLKSWKVSKHPSAKAYITAIKQELKLRN